jgi:hypothetical protein
VARFLSILVTDDVEFFSESTYPFATGLEKMFYLLSLILI